MPSLRSSPRIRCAPEPVPRSPWWRSAPESLRSIEASPAGGLSASADRAASLGPSDLGATGDRASLAPPSPLRKESPDYQPEKRIPGLKVGARTRAERDFGVGAVRAGSRPPACAACGRALPVWGGRCAVVQLSWQDRRSRWIEFSLLAGLRRNRDRAGNRRGLRSPLRGPG